MNKLVSKSPIQRFKQGKKILKAEEGLGLNDPYISRGNRLKSWLKETFSDWNPYTGFVRKSNSANPQQQQQTTIPNNNQQQTFKEKEIIPLGGIQRLVSNHEHNIALSRMKNSSKPPTKQMIKPKQRSGWSYGYNRSNEISDIKATQQMLKDAGYLYSDKYDVVDGKWGSDTENAYKKYLLNKEKPVIAPTQEEIQQVLPQIAKQAQPTLTPKLTNFTPLRIGTFNKSQIRKLISERLGQNAYNYTGAQRKALRQYLNGESDDTSLLTNGLEKFIISNKQGGQLVSRNPVKRFKSNFRLVAQ